MAYAFKNFEYYQMGGTKDKYYECIVSLDLPEDLVRDIKDYILNDRDNYISLKEEIEKDALDDFRHFLNQNNIKFSISRYYPMEFNMGTTYSGQLEVYIDWETPISDKNKLALDKLDALIN